METEKYKLFLTDDSSMSFLDWRNKINGQTDSNMIKIEAALGEKAENSISKDLILLANAWTGTAAPYEQVLTVNGLTPEHNGIISVAHTATIEQRMAARDALLVISKQENNQLTIVADGSLPQYDIPVSIIIIG